jgi:Neuraminidase (sialidase)
MHPNKFVKFLTVMALLAVLTFLTVGLAAASSLVLVSGPSPYATCSNDGQTGKNFVNAEVEPWVAENPANSSNLIGVWQQDRWSNGGAHGLVAGFSFNGGKTWGETTLPFDACAPGTPSSLQYERASDPWVSVGPDGTAYTVSISFNNTNNNNAVAAATSTDGGRTWGNVRVIIADNAPNFQFFNDKESVTADPVKAGVAYVVWDRLEAPNANPDADLHTRAFKGPAFFSKTTNGGVSWSTPKIIVDFTASNQQTIANQIVVDPRNGTLYNFFDLIKPPSSPSPYNVAFIKSTDGGSTWTKPQIIANLQTVFVSDPNTGERIRTGDIIPEPAIDPATGQLYVVWQDSRFNGGHFDEVALSTSTNGGATWSAPIQVNTNTPSNRPGFTSAIYVNSAGVVGVSYYDFRSLTTETTTLPTDYWFRTVTSTLSLGPETHITGPFDMKTAPFARGFFVGDYEGLTAVGTTFHPFFVAANSGNTSNRTDVFTTAQ